MNETIRLKIRAKNTMYNKYIQNERSESHFLLLETLKTEPNELTNAIKDLYYQNLSKRLNNRLLEAKSHWSILKIFYNEKKIPLILPLMVNDKFVTDIKMKTCIFYNFFAEQCTPLKNDSILPVIKYF